MKKQSFTIRKPSNRAIHLFGNDLKGFGKLPGSLQYKTRLWAICSGYARPDSRYWEWHDLASLVSEAEKYTLVEKPKKSLTPRQRRKRRKAAAKAAQTRNRNRTKAERKRIARNRKARSIKTVSGGKFS